jgi:hypothetical protein
MEFFCLFIICTFPLIWSKESPNLSLIHVLQWHVVSRCRIPRAFVVQLPVMKILQSSLDTDRLEIGTTMQWSSTHSCWMSYERSCAVNEGSSETRWSSVNMQFLVNVNIYVCKVSAREQTVDSGCWLFNKEWKDKYLFTDVQSIAMCQISVAQCLYLCFIPCLSFTPQNKLQDAATPTVFSAHKFLVDSNSEPFSYGE